MANDRASLAPRGKNPMQVTEYTVAVSESDAQADTRSVCVIRTTVDNISTVTERCAFFSAIAALSRRWSVWLNNRAFAHDPKGRRFESRPVHFQVTALGKLLTRMCLCHQAV